MTNDECPAVPGAGVAVIPLIVLERSGNWATALRSRFNESEVRVFETRTASDCRQRLLQHPRAIAALELTAANARPLLSTLLALHSELPGVCSIIMAERRMAGYESLFREAGAIHFVVSPRSLGDVGQIVRRFAALDASSASAPSDRDDPRPAIVANLPWSDFV